MNSDDAVAMLHFGKRFAVEDLERMAWHGMARGFISTSLREARISSENPGDYQSLEYEFGFVSQITTNKQHPFVVNAEFLLELSSTESLPVIALEFATFLMEEERRLRNPIAAGNDYDNNKNNNGNIADDNTALTCPQKRCLEAPYERTSGRWRICIKGSVGL